MAGERDRIVKLASYIESLGIQLNIGKNKAKGNKGIFKTDSKRYRIDVAKNLSDDEMLHVLVHELAHYAHYCNNKSLSSLDFIFKDGFEKFEEDLLKLTVNAIPKDFASQLFNQKAEVKKEIKSISNAIKSIYPDIKLSIKNNPIEKDIKKTEYKYLMKYDRVKIRYNLSTRIYTIDNLTRDFPDIKPEHLSYIKLSSLKRRLNRINSKISRLNRYYNSPTELFARSVECFILNPSYMEKETPELYSYYKDNLYKLKILSDMKF